MRHVFLAAFLLGVLGQIVPSSAGLPSIGDLTIGFGRKQENSNKGSNSNKFSNLATGLNNFVPNVGNFLKQQKGKNTSKESDSSQSDNSGSLEKSSKGQSPPSHQAQNVGPSPSKGFLGLDKNLVNNIVPKVENLLRQHKDTNPSKESDSSDSSDSSKKASKGSSPSHKYTNPSKRSDSSDSSKKASKGSSPSSQQDSNGGLRRSPSKVFLGLDLDNNPVMKNIVPKVQNLLNKNKGTHLSKGSDSSDSSDSSKKSRGSSPSSHQDPNGGLHQSPSKGFLGLGLDNNVVMNNIVPKVEKLFKQSGRKNPSEKSQKAHKPSKHGGKSQESKGQNKESHESKSGSSESIYLSAEGTK